MDLVESLENNSFEKVVKEVFFLCADKDAALFGTIDTSAEVVDQRLEKRIQRLIKIRVGAGVNRFCYKRRRALRLVAIIVALLLIPIISLNILASREGKTTAEYIQDNIGIVLKQLKPGDSITVDGFTVNKPHTGRQYGSIEEAMEQEGLKLMYPTVLPEGITVSGIDYAVMGDNGEFLASYVNNSSLAISICAKNYAFTADEYLDAYEEHKINGYTFYILEHKPGYICRWKIDGIEYYVSAKKREDLMLIISNMKMP